MIRGLKFRIKEEERCTKEYAAKTKALITVQLICAFVAWGTLVPHALSIWATFKLAPATDHG